MIIRRSKYEYPLYCFLVQIYRQLIMSLSCKIFANLKLIE